MTGKDTIPDEIRGRYVTAAGHRLCVDECGSGERGAIFCLHTAGMSSLEWRFFLPHFGRRGYRAAAADLPGHGKSLLAGWKPIESIHEYAEVVWQALPALEMERPVLVGCSIGGDIVLDLGVHHPDAWAAIVCCEAAMRTRTFPEELLERGREDAGVPGYHEFTFYRTGALCGCGTPAERVREIQWLRRRGDPKIQIHDLIAWNHHDLGEKLSRIRVPTLFVRGQDDSGIGEEAIRTSCRAVAGAEMVVLPGVGHFPMAEYDDFAVVVEEFLRRHGL